MTSMSDSSTVPNGDDAQGQTAPTPESVLSLTEFVSALWAEFPGADVVDERTTIPDSRDSHHAASLVVNGCRFGVKYRLGPLPSANRWVASRGGATAATPSGLRPHFAAHARDQAERSRVGAEEWAFFAEKLPGAALYFEGPARRLKLAATVAAERLRVAQQRAMKSLIDSLRDVAWAFIKATNSPEFAEAERVAALPSHSEMASAVARLVEEQPIVTARDAVRAIPGLSRAEAKVLLVRLCE